MARDNVAVTPLSVNAGTALPAGTTINHSNGANIALAGNTRGIVVLVTNVDTNPHNVTVRAGADPPAGAQGLGDLVQAIAASSTEVLTLTSHRFVQADGSINIDFDAGLDTGKISCLQISKAL